MKYRCFFNNRFWYFVIGQIMSDYELKIYNEACLNGANFHLGTGVRDMLGKDIYAGDKVVYTLNNDSSQKEIEAEIEWHNHAWRLNRIWLLTEIRTIKVIGDVYYGYR